MPLYGNQLSPSQATVDLFNGDGSTTVFVATNAPNLSSDNPYFVFVDGVLQQLGAGKQVARSGLTFTFSLAPPTGTENIIIVCTAERIDILQPADGSVDTEQLAADAVENDKVLNATLDVLKLNATLAKNIAKAWIVFNGTGTPAVNDSFNIDPTITDNGTGDYSITFTTDFANTNFLMTGSCESDLTTDNLNASIRNGDKATTGVRIHVRNSAGTLTDSPSVMLMFYGDQ